MQYQQRPPSSFPPQSCSATQQCHIQKAHVRHGLGWASITSLLCGQWSCLPCQHIPMCCKECLDLDQLCLFQVQPIKMIRCSAEDSHSLPWPSWYGGHKSHTPPHHVPIDDSNLNQNCNELNMQTFVKKLWLTLANNPYHNPNHCSHRCSTFTAIPINRNREQSFLSPLNSVVPFFKQIRWKTQWWYQLLQCKLHANATWTTGIILKSLSPQEWFLPSCTVSICWCQNKWHDQIQDQNIWINHVGPSPILLSTWIWSNLTLCKLPRSRPNLVRNPINTNWIKITEY